MISVVIPAHNEAGVIGACLDAILADQNTESALPLEIVVVCNACTDATAQVAASYGPAVRVIETDTPGKVNALNLGDDAATAFPRFYIDADVIVRPDAIRQVAGALGQPGCLAAAPRLVVDTADAPWPVRGFFKTWMRTGYHRQGMIGSGVYAVSEAGRARFDRFPEIIADDAFARCQFAPHERRVLEDCTFTVRAPRSTWSLIKIKTRSHLGNRELAIKYPDLWAVSTASYNRLPAREALPPHRWPATAAYVWVKAIARLRSELQFRKGAFGVWERDETTRKTADPGSPSAPPSPLT